MSFIDNNNFQHQYLGIINGSVRSFTQKYDARETNIQIIVICLGIFAFSIFKDFIYTLWHTLKDIR